jgi:hypothetical protein
MDIRAKRLSALGALLVLAGVGGAALAATSLRDGLAEIPSHWWSTATALPILLGLSLFIVVFRRAR